MQIYSERFEQNPAIKYFGHLAFLLMTIFAAVFYLERMIFVDPSFITFTLLDEGDYAVQVYRFGVVLTQSVPLLFHHCGASLKTILLAYSLTFPLLYWLIYTILVHLLRAERAGMALLLIFSLMACNSFYWIIAEYHQGMAFLVLFWVWMHRSFARENYGWLEWVGQALLLIVILFFHPVILFPTLFAMGFLFFDLKDKKQVKFWALVAFTLVVFAVKNVYFSNPYDSGKIAGAIKSLISFISGQDWRYLKQFLKDCTYDYLFFVLGFLAMLVFYIKQRKFGKMLWMVALVSSYVAIIIFSIGQDAQKIYVDGMLFAAGFMVALPLLYDLLPVLGTTRKLAPALILGLLLAIRLPIIIVAHQPMTERLHWIADLVDTMRAHPESNRFFIHKEDLPMDKLFFEWGLCYETLLYSSLESPDSACVAIAIPVHAVSVEQAAQIVEQNVSNVIYCPWWGMPYDKPSFRRYFNMGEKPYRMLKIKSSDQSQKSKD